MKNKHVGSRFDSFLEELGISADVAAKAAKKAFAYQLEKKLESKKKTKSSLRRVFNSASTAERLFDEHTGISLDTMAKAADFVGCGLDIRLVAKTR
jgi:antitoxin HicB